MRGPLLIALVFIVIVVGAFVGYFIGTRSFPSLGILLLSPTPLSPTSTPLSISPPASPAASITPSIPAADSVKTFYTWYIGCLTHHFQIQSRKSVAEDCPYSASPYASTKLSANLSPTALDPVVCSQSIPQTVIVDTSTLTSPTSASVHVVETIGSAKLQIVVSLDKEADTWRISNITCPKT